VPATIRGIHKLDDSHRYGGWKPDRPSIKDYKFASLRAAQVQEIPNVSEDRRAKGWNAPVMDQANIGSCVGCSSCYGVYFLDDTDHDGVFDIYSPLFAYYNARTKGGVQYKAIDSGAMIRDSMDCLRTIGAAPELDWKYVPAKFSARPPQKAFMDAKKWKLGAHYRVQGVQQIMQALAAGYAVVGGITVYASMMTEQVARTGEVPMPTSNEELLGAHALYWDMYDKPAGKVRFENSWGTGWGDNGYGYVPLEYLDNPDLADDFWAMQAEDPSTVEH